MSYKKKGLSLGQRIWLPVVIVIGMLTVTSLLLIARTVRLVDDSRVQQESQQSKLELSLGLDEMARTHATAAAGGQKAEQDAAAQRLKDRLQQLGRIASADDEKRVLASAQQALDAYLAGGGGAPPLSQLEALHKQQVAQSVALREQITAARMKSTWAVFGVTVIVAILMSISTLYLSRTIINPVKSLIRLAEHMGEGDLSRTISVDRGDELGTLQQALSNMREELADMVLRAREGADSVQTAAAEIAGGNLDLSQRTERTAAHVQQTTNALNDLGVAVKHTAESASTANQLAQQAAQVAQRGGAAVGQVVATMGEINHSSKKIADIIGVIDGIAFQTNILALNAAVEAARAGEQGRGFAVVAGEVRSLAGRSAEAAKEIKSLISASVEKVESGSRQVTDAGSAMDELVGSVNRVSDVIGEISASSGEQAEHLGQVAASMGELDQMSQSNAALVEQGAAAAESLKEQAVKLHQLVSRYRVAASEQPKAPKPMAAPKPAPKAAPKQMTPPKPMAAAPARATAAPKSAPAPVAAPAPAAPRPAPAPADDGDWETF